MAIRLIAQRFVDREKKDKMQLLYRDRHGKKYVARCKCSPDDNERDPHLFGTLPRHVK